MSARRRRPPTRRPRYPSPDALAAGLTAEAVIPNGVDLDRFAFSDPAGRPPVMIFFGNLGYFHNVEPARFLASEVLPRVRQGVPEAVLRIAGARPSASLRRAVEARGAELIDSPADLIGELRRAAVAVLPMFSGSGIKNKVLEAFAVGLPVVANASGVEGIAEPGPESTTCSPRTPTNSRPAPPSCSSTRARGGASRAPRGRWSRPTTRGTTRPPGCSRCTTFDLHVRRARLPDFRLEERPFGPRRR